MTDDLWVRRYHPSPQARVRLVCLPHAGGSASFFLPMSKALSPAVDVLCVQYPGRQDRRNEPCVQNLEDLAEQVTRVLLPWLGMPLALFGHSMGATLAFEIARRIERDHATSPVHLFASGRRSPSRRRNERVHLADDRALLAELRSLSGTDALVFGDEEVLRMVLPAIRGDYRAAETYSYQPGPRLSCPITVLVGDADTKVTAEEALAWREHTDGEFDCRTFDGGHFYLTGHQEEILRLVTERLLTSAGRR
jgi:surfactin synthase thioesterase subunit